MNSEQFEGKWKEARGVVKEKWGKLTDDDIEVIDGKKDKLVGKLQTYYGMTKENADAAVDRWMDRENEAIHDEHLWETIQGSWVNLVGHIKKQYGKLVDDKLVESKGRRDELAGLIQQHYGVSLGDAYEMVDDWADKAITVPTGERSMK